MKKTSIVQKKKNKQNTITDLFNWK